MKKREYLLVGIASFTLTTLALYAIKKININRKLKKASDAGYETVHDILYPKRNIASGSLRLGPILPE